MTTDAAGTTAVNGGLMKTTLGQTYNDPVVLSGNATLITLSGGNVVFGATVNDDGNPATASSLDIQTTPTGAPPNGQVIFGDVVGGIHSLDSLTITTGGPMVLAHNITTSGNIDIKVRSSVDPANDQLTVQPGVTITAITGDIALRARDTLTLAASSHVVASAGSVTLEIGYLAHGGTGFIGGEVKTSGGKVQVNGAAGDDALTIDLATASLPQGLDFSAGDGDDTLVINGTSATDVFCINDVTGVIKWQGNELIDYQSVEHIEVHTGAGDDQVGFQMSTNPTTVYVDGGADNGTTPIHDGFKIVGTDGNDVVVVGDYNAGDTYTVPAVVLAHQPPGVTVPATLPVRFKVRNIESLQLFGGTGNDILVNDVQSPAVGSLLNGGSGNDVLIGGDAGNVIFGGDGVDSLFGGTGNDYLFPDHEFLQRDANGRPVAFPLGGEVVEGGGGVDTVVALGTDTVNTGGLGHIIGEGLSLSVIDWLKAQFEQPTDSAINAALDVADGQPYAQPFQCGVQPVQVAPAGPQTFTLSGPTSGAYQVGDNVSIQWTAGNVAAGSKISLCYDQDTTWWNGNEHWIEIDAVAAANGAGTYSWSTAGMAPGKYYLAGYLWNGASAFTMSHLTQAITINAAAAQTFALSGPTSGTYYAGQAVNINWTASNVKPGSKISLCYDEDTTWWNGNEHWIEVDAVAAANGTGTYSWTTTGMAPGKYYLAGYLWNGASAFTMSHLTQAITITAAPAQTFALNSPTFGTYLVGGTVNIKWTAGNVVAGSKISLCYDEDTTWWNGNEHWIEIDAVAAANGTHNYSWNTAGVASGKYYLAGYLWNGASTFTMSHLTQAITIAAPLTLAVPQESAPTSLPGSAVLESQSELTPIVDEAVRRLAGAVGGTALAGVSIQIADLPGTLLGETIGNKIVIDRDAAGYGWYIDSTPYDDLEFPQLVSGDTLAAKAGSAAAQHVDLLTAVMHEMGHVLGYDDTTSSGLMCGSLSLGQRRLFGEGPAWPAATDASGHAHGSLVDADAVDGVFAAY